MNKYLTWTALMVSSLASAGVPAFGQGGAGIAPASFPPLVCDAALIKGAYALKAIGWRGAGAANSPFQPVVAVRVEVFDGVSKASSGPGYLSVSGAPVPFSGAGSYRVLSDCTFSFVGASGGVQGALFGVVTDHGDHIHTIRIDQAFTLRVDFERIRP
jgi:hypothetical protein